MHRADSPNCGANCTQTVWEARGQYSTHIFTQRAEVIIAAHDPEDTLFLYLPYQAVHVPKQVPASYKQPYNFTDPDRNAFAGMLSALDEGIGNVTKALVKKGEHAYSIHWECHQGPSEEG